MPIYEYKCGTCDKIIEVYCKMDDVMPFAICTCGNKACHTYKTGAAYVKKTRVGDVWDKAGVNVDTKKKQKQRVEDMRKKK